MTVFIAFLAVLAAFAGGFLSGRRKGRKLREEKERMRSF